MELVWSVALLFAAWVLGVAGWVAFQWLPTQWRKRNAKQ